MPNSIENMPQVAYPRTDCGNARMFADNYGGKVRFDRTSGKWLAWDGKRWSREGGEIQAQMYCRGVAIAWHQRMGGCESKEEQKDIFRHWQYSASATGIRNLLFVARSEPGLSLSAEELDTKPFLLNVSDGTIDLKTGVIKPHDPDDLLTQLAPVHYKAGEERLSIEKWAECLHTWHPEDDGSIEYLRRLMGYCLTGSTSSRCFPIFWGSGKNGKNVFLDTFLLMLGDYAAIAPRTLVEATGREEHFTEIADLWGKRLVLASEPKKGSKLKVSLVKAMTGDSRMKARFMRQDFFEFTPTHKLIMMTQNLPVVDETTDAIWDRIHKLRWGVRISKERQNPRLVEDLKAEWPGILRWAIQGCLEWQRPPGTLLPTAKIERETRDYREEQNPVKKFVDTMFVMGKWMFVPSGTMNQMLADWASFAENDTVVTRGALHSYLVDNGCTNGTRRITGAGVERGWWGIGRRSQEAE